MSADSELYQDSARLEDALKNVRECLKDIVEADDLSKLKGFFKVHLNDNMSSMCSISHPLGRSSFAMISAVRGVQACPEKSVALFWEAGKYAEWVPYFKHAEIIERKDVIPSASLETVDSAEVLCSNLCDYFTEIRIVFKYFRMHCTCCRYMLVDPELNGVVIIDRQPPAQSTWRGRQIPEVRAGYMNVNIVYQGILVRSGSTSGTCDGYFVQVLDVGIPIQVLAPSWILRLIVSFFVNGVFVKALEKLADSEYDNIIAKSPEVYRRVSKFLEREITETKLTSPFSPFSSAVGAERFFSSMFLVSRQNACPDVRGTLKPHHGDSCEDIIDIDIFEPDTS